MNIQIDTDFPGGNVVVERIDGQDITVRPDLRDTEGHWFYWCFRLGGAGGQTLRFHLTRDRDVTGAGPAADPDAEWSWSGRSMPLSVMGPAVSLDGGWTWRWLGPGCLEGDRSFRFTCPADVPDVRLSMGMPYTLAQWQAFAARYRGDGRVRRGVLCRTRQGRDAEQMLAGCLDTEPAHRMLLTARNHCCEMMASYVIEGILEAALGDDELGRWFERNVQILTIPLVDLDGVERGDQGKYRRPRDHNRDYDGVSVHPETAAIRRTVPEWSQGRLHLAIDLHCPLLRGEFDENIYIVGSRDEARWREQCRFSEALQRHRTGPLPYVQSNNLPFGERWNVAANSSQGMGCSRWAAQLPGIWLATPIEIPYSLAGGQEVNQQSARAFGHDVARAVRAYLEGGAPAEAR